MKGLPCLRLVAILIVVTAAVWIVPLVLSVESGLRFGWPYRIFFTFVILLGGFLFYLLAAPPTPPLQSTRGAFGRVALVFVTSIGGIVLLANFAPQFGFEGSASAAATPQERGRALFTDPKVGCFLCHSVGGSGGTRGPDLTHVAAVAGSRRPGMSAEDYLRDSLLNPDAYVVLPYDNIMPPIVRSLPSEALGDLLAYLLSLK